MTQSSSYVNDPTVGTGQSHSQQSSGAFAGAAQGAAAGASLGSAVPVIGTVIGAVAGAVIGGVMGYIGGGAMDKATLHKKKAEKWATLGKEREAAIERLNILNKFREARAANVTAITAEGSGGMLSSATGAISSVQSQYSFAENFMQSQVGIQRNVARQLRKAGRSANKANQMFGYLDAASSLASSFGSYGLSFGKAKGGGIGLTEAQGTGAANSINQQFGGNYLSSLVG